MEDPESLTASQPPAAYTSRGTYGRKRAVSPSSDSQDAAASSSSQQLFDSSPPARSRSQGGNSSRTGKNGLVGDDEDTGNTTASSADADGRATIKLRTNVNPRVRLDSVDLSQSDEDDGGDDDGGQKGDAVARLRAAMGSSSAGASQARSSSLSSAPPLPSQARSHSKSSGLNDGTSSGSEADSEELSSSLFKVNRRGAMAGRMKKRDGQKEAEALNRARPALDLVSEDESPSSSQASLSSSQQDSTAADKARRVALDRRSKLAEMAAKKRVPSPSLEDEFFGQIQREESRSSAFDDPISEGEDELEDPRDMVRRALSAKAKKQDKARKSSSGKDKAPAGPKQLSKKEIEEMHKTMAKIERSKPIASLALQNHPIQRPVFNINQLAAKFKTSDQNGTKAVEDATASDPIEAATPSKARATSSMDDIELSPTSKKMLYGNVENFPPRLNMTQASAVQKEDSEQQARDRALKAKKERWLEAQRQSKPAAAAQSSKATIGGILGDDLTVIGRPSAKAAAPKPEAATAIFNNSLQDQIRRQNLKARALREAANARAGIKKAEEKASAKDGDDDDSIEALRRIQDRVQRVEAAAAGRSAFADASDGEAGDDDDDASDDEDFVIGEDGKSDTSHQRGSGSEADDDDDEEKSIRYSGDELDEEEDADITAALEGMPPSSQNTNRSSRRASTPPQDLEPIDDDDDDEAERTIQSSRRARVKMAVVDEDEDGQGKGTISDDIAGESEGNRNSSTSSPDEIETISSNDKTSSAASGGRFAFLQSMRSREEPRLPDSQRLQASDPAETAGGKTGGLSGGPTASGDSVLGQFFADTQLSGFARGQSLDVIGATGRAKNAENAFPFLQSSSSGGGGLSQFFEEGTQLPGTSSRQPSFVASQLMPPPTSVRTDGFAALRKAAQAENNLDLFPSSLPDNVDFDDNEDVAAFGALDASAEGSRDAPKQYLNSEGFFTQTRPSFSSSQWESQSQGREEEGEGEEDNVDLPSSQNRKESAQDSQASNQMPQSPTAERRKRFRRAVAPIEADDNEDETAGAVRRNPAQSDVEEENDGGEGSEHGSGEEEEEEEDEEDQGDPAGSGSEAEDADIHPGMKNNAWDILRQGAANAALAKQKKRQREYQFFEGEAEESDEDEEGRRGRGGAGGLDGVFSDSDSGDEDDDEDDDGRDLENLVNNEKEIDEKAKDILARERYQQDLDADEQAALALANKAAAGELRNRRRARDGEGRLVDLLDDDFDEERLMRKANNPRNMVAKRRKIEGDEMGILASKEESRAFVQGYAETHQAQNGDEYGFLQDVVENSSASSDDDDDDDDGGEDAYDDGASGSGALIDENGDEVVPDDQDEAPIERVTRKQLARELREQRQRRKRAVLSDDEGDRPSAKAAKKSRDPWASTDEEDEDEDGDSYARVSAVPSFLRQHAASGPRAASNKAACRVESDSMTLPHEHDELTSVLLEEDATSLEADPASAILRGLERRKQRPSSPRTAARMAKLVEEFRAEPEYAAGRQAVFAAARAGGGGSKSGSSITSLGGRPPMMSGGGGQQSRTSGSGTFKGGVGSASWNANKQQQSVATLRKSTTLPPSRSVSGGILAERRVEESQ